MTNDRICPEDFLKIILPVGQIPDKAVVTKALGEKEYRLRRNLTIRRPHGNSIVISGYFLVADDGEFQQVHDQVSLGWKVAAEDFVELMNRSWSERVDHG